MLTNQVFKEKNRTVSSEHQNNHKILHGSIITHICCMTFVTVSFQHKINNTNVIYKVRKQTRKTYCFI